MPRCAPYSTGDPASFGYSTARERWPAIVGNAIEDLNLSIASTDSSEKSAEGVKIRGELEQLKQEIIGDAALVALPDDGSSELKQYNQELEQRGRPTWLNTPWLFAECYLFRRLNSSFKRSVHWKDYDVFFCQKMDTFRSSRPAVLELASKYKDLIAKGPAISEEAEKTLFLEICEICLWGNATDLSLLTNITYEDIQKLQGSQARKAAEKNLLANDLPAVFDLLKQKKRNKTPAQVDIVLDNAGFELFVDLFLAGYLLSSGLAASVVLHPKSIPWFVSDVVPADFDALLQALRDPRKFYETGTNKPLSDEEVSQLTFLFSEWDGYREKGQLCLQENGFWTDAGSFWRLPAVNPVLFASLRTSDLVIFKGDLNYRKLTGDVAWDASTPFPDAIGPLGPRSGLSVLALRTCKADVVVGLKPGVDEELKAGDNSGARKWGWSGKWAVASLSTE
ncbi:DUF89-domain-containing protein [Thozetella sp. PMI_491]|nr:DUF89-domain-containing protein [Thozetella sp. PMI_491]